MAHLWLMQATKDELKKHNGAFVISASVAGLRPGGSSMVSDLSVGQVRGPKYAVPFGFLGIQERASGLSRNHIVATPTTIAETCRRDYRDGP